MRFVASAFLAAALLLAACGPVTPAVSGASADRHGNGACISGSTWHGGSSSVMRPGEDCISCHTQQGGPAFAVAGSIFTNYDEPNDCDGVTSMQITVTDSASPSHVYNLHSNSAGNFYLQSQGAAGITFPISVVITDPSDGSTREMLAAQPTGSCNSCHTNAGAEGAPGRVITP